MILTDDLDYDSISEMPNLRSLMVERGTTFENSFVTNSICCPSRATLLRGQYSHNHGVLTNGPLTGGFQKFRELERQNSTLVTWLDDGGYQTALFGKYLNGTPGDYEVPGWDIRNDIGNKGDVYPTDWYSDEASAFLREAGESQRPFYLQISTKAPHTPAIPAPRHEDEFPNARAPRPPSFGEEDVSDKPEWIREKRSLSKREIEYIDDLHRKRLQSMLAVDEMIGRLMDDLQKNGELDDTYIVFTSDNGWAQGEHGRRAGKSSAYEEDIRVPLIIRGPGVPEGEKRKHMVTNNDLAPTFSDLAEIEAPDFVDGRSFTPLLTDDPPSPDNWRRAFLVEGYDNNSEKSIRTPFKAVRTETHLWVEYETGERELYDMREDPYQTESLHETADPALIEGLREQLDALRDCAADECREAEGFSGGT